MLYGIEDKPWRVRLHTWVSGSVNGEKMLRKRQSSSIVGGQAMSGRFPVQFCKKKIIIIKGDSLGSSIDARLMQRLSGISDTVSEVPVQFCHSADKTLD